MPFRSQVGAMEDDGIAQWQAVRRLGSGVLTLASFDYKNPYAQLVSGHSLNAQGDVFAHEIYENTGSYGFKDSRDGEQLAQRLMEEKDRMTQYFEAAGNGRTAQAGRTFQLGGHFSADPRRPVPGEPARESIGAREYLIVSVHHSATNNYQAGPKAASHYENKFVCTRKSIRWRPGRNYNSKPSRIPYTRVTCAS